MEQINKELKRSRKQSLIQTSVTILLILLVSLALGVLKTNLPVLSSIGPQGSQGPKGDNGETSLVDYNQINSYINSKIAALPKPQNGATGMTGKDGQNANPCTTTQTETGSQISCPDGTTSTVNNGSQGEAGSQGRALQQRCVQIFPNPRVDTRYEGDVSWTPAYYLPFGSFCP